MDHIGELNALVAAWIKYVDDNPGTGEGAFTRQAGYRAGLLVCADQVNDLIKRMLADDDA